MKTDQPTATTRKKQKIYQSPTVKIQPLPRSFNGSTPANNLQEQKDRFLRHGKTPVFVMHGDTSTVDELASKTSGRIRFDLLGEAQHILQTVKHQYGVGENYLEHIYGPRINQDEANQILFDYIKENSLQESLSVYWSNDLNCSARMVWKGYSFKCNRPEMRRYSLWLNGTSENPYLRQYGLRCLLDHEIGTHFYRNFNDGLQPWFSDRKKFGLRSAGSFESLCTEEGLAAINTTLRAKEKYLWLSALVYYTACKSTEMTFKQLFDHLGQFLDSPEQRWKHVMRVKRGLVDPNDLGGYGKDQCYFEGAVTILRNLDDINFQLLMSGKICYDEVDRIKRLARTGSIVLPFIMRNMKDYRKQLKRMAIINGLHIPHQQYMPPRDYLKRLKEREAGIVQRRKVRKRKKSRASLSNHSSSTGSEASSCQLPGHSDEFNNALQELKFEGSKPKDLEEKSSAQHCNKDVKVKKTLLMHDGSNAKVKRSDSFQTVKNKISVNETNQICLASVASSSSSVIFSSPNISKESCVSSSDKFSTRAFPSDSCIDFDEVSAKSCSSLHDVYQPNQDLVLPVPKERPKSVYTRTHSGLSLLNTLGTYRKLEITRVIRPKTAINEEGQSCGVQCEGLVCNRPFSTTRSESGCCSPDIHSWLLTVTPPISKPGPSTPENTPPNISSDH